MSKGDFSPATLTIFPSLCVRRGRTAVDRPSRRRSRRRRSPRRRSPIRPRNFSLKGKSLSVATGLPSKSMTRILPLKLVTQTLSRVTAVPQPTPSMPMPVKPVIGGESGVPLGVNLEDAAADALADAGLRTRHPVLPAPQIAVRVEHEPAIGVHPAAGEGEHEGEVVRGPDEIGRERRRAPGAVLGLRVGLVEQREEVLRVGPRFSGDVGHRLQRVLRRVAAGRGRGLEKAGAPVIVARRRRTP